MTSLKSSNNRRPKPEGFYDAGTKLHCYRCKQSWRKRFLGPLPDRCGLCKSPNWNKPPKFIRNGGVVLKWNGTRYVRMEPTKGLKS